MATRIALIALTAFAAWTSASAQTSYLARNDRIVCVGDSITAAGLSITFVDQALRTLYPDGGITLHNLGQGGASAPAGASSLAGYLDKKQPTLATFMFGVNDTRWSEGQTQEKVGQFLGGLKAAVACVAGHKLDRRITVEGGDTADVAFELPVSGLGKRWGAVPLYVAFVGREAFAADGTLFFHSQVRAAAREPLLVADGEFTTAAAGKAGRCPVSGVRLSRERDSLCVDFTWKDATPVAARPGFHNTFGKQIDKPVDLGSRGGQPCDAVEFFFDLRGEQAIGRWTSAADDNPPGILRLAVYRENVDRTNAAAGLAANVVTADEPPATVRLESTGENTWRLIVLAKPAGAVIGFSMRVTDSEDFEGPRAEPFHLTFGQGQEPMSYLLFGDSAAGVFCRIGY